MARTRLQDGADRAILCISIDKDLDEELRQVSSQLKVTKSMIVRAAVRVFLDLCKANKEAKG